MIRPTRKGSARRAAQEATPLPHGTIVRSDIPARLDALPWSAWHWRVVIALGVSWMLDGLEVTLVGSLGGVLQRDDTLGLSPAEIGLAGSAYIAGAVLGALYFGRLADRLGRKRIFLVTMVLYLAATMMSALSVDFLTFAAFRFLTGFGIGGEYGAINSAIDELIPARVRGRVNLAINGTFWLGAALGAGLSLALLDSAILGAQLGWRIAFALGGAIGIAIVLVRRHVPESPRWLLTHGRAAEAEAVVAAIESRVRGAQPSPTNGGSHASLTLSVGPLPSWSEIARILIDRSRRRALLGIALMVSQAFFYNTIFFTYALVLTRFYGVPDVRVGLYIFPFAVGNFLGPLLLGRLFDAIGRRPMITATYALSGIGLAVTGYAFTRGWLDATTQTACWVAIFFIASAAASAAYLTVSELFPLEMRAVAISLFYSVGTGAGGFVAPALFGVLIASGSREAVFGGYALGAVLMLIAATTTIAYGVAAERRPLEAVARPLGMVDDRDDRPD
jgi:MFS family permease